MQPKKLAISAKNNIIKVSRAIIENCPAPCYFTQYLGYVIK